MSYFSHPSVAGRESPALSQTCGKWNPLISDSFKAGPSIWGHDVDLRDDLTFRGESININPKFWTLDLLQGSRSCLLKQVCLKGAASARPASHVAGENPRFVSFVSGVMQILRASATNTRIFSVMEISQVVQHAPQYIIHLVCLPSLYLVQRHFNWLDIRCLWSKLWPPTQGCL